ncbi:cytochrome P450 94A1-like [Euphorbia lathyris]|uniref:cytochrome P450 94A1-like n=1 Tax=Euphorbia lathyris TaxID=212925 RepID=UPI003313C70B
MLTFILQLFFSFFLLLFPLIILSIFRSPKTSPNLPKSYPIIGHYFDLKANWNRRAQWISSILQNSPSATFTLFHPTGGRRIVTGNPANVQHILKTRFHNYQKGNDFRTILSDFLGNGIFNADGDTWKFQRQIASHEFNTKSLRKFIETVVDTELSRRLIPILSSAAKTREIIDFQDVLQRFMFDNICQIAFGYDPQYLLPSLPEEKFARAFEDGVRISSERFNSLLWKIRRFFNVGSERKLREAVAEVRDFAVKLVKEKKGELKTEKSIESVDLLSRFLSSGHSDEKFVTDIVISFIIAGRDTTSAALTWFFWVLSENPDAETEIINEITEKSETETPVFEEVRSMVYTHAALCESMRLYPPVPADTKFAEDDDVWPDGTAVKKGTAVTYHPFAMGRLAMLWGSDWAEYKPERWLRRDGDSGKWSFVGRDAYTYPVFQGGPRICLGKEMAFLQMKRVVAGVLSKFKVVPVMEPGVEPEFYSYLTAKMRGGFPVRIEERVM